MRWIVPFMLLALGACGQSAEQRRAADERLRDVALRRRGGKTSALESLTACTRLERLARTLATA